MTTDLSDRQKEIIEKLCGDGRAQIVIQKIITEQLSFSEIENICNIINDEFLLRGLLSSYEPNAYGLELEALLDEVNRPRLARRPD
jgi:hypothetical protein